jgi:hypothetical protein
MPQVGKNVRINSLRNLLVAKVTADTAAALTFGTAIPLGVQSELTFGLNQVTEDLKGARGTVESDKYVDNATWNLKHGEISLDLWALAFGGTVVQDPESGVGAGDSKSLYGLKQGLSAGYIGIIGQPVTIAGGPADYYIALLKCQVESFDPGKMGGGGWSEVTMGGRAFYTSKDKLLFMAAICEKREDGTFEIVTQDLATFMAG